MPVAPDLDLRMRQGDPSVWPRWNPRLIDEEDVSAAWESVLTRRGEPGFPDTIRAYTHFAYCESSCNFCMYWHKVPKGEDAYARHASYLIERVKWFSQRFGRLPISSAYFGGGTPTAPPIAELERYLEAFSDAFDVAGEFTVEGHPNVTTAEKIALLADHGVRRLSMGLQTLEHDVLVRITRRNAPLDHLSGLVRAARDRSMIVNLDLILGLPGQSLESFRADVERVMGLGPDVITLYLYEPVKRLPDEPPSEMNYEAALTPDLRAAIDATGYELADPLFPGQRSLRLALKDPTRPTRFPEAHTYAQFDELPSHTIALGPGAYGHVFGHYWFRDVTSMGALEEGRARYYGTALTPVDECRSILLDAIQRGDSVDVATVRERTGVELELEFSDAFAAAAAAGVVSPGGDTLEFRRDVALDEVRDAIVPESPGALPAPRLDHSLVEPELVATRRDEEELARGRELLSSFREQLQIPTRGHQVVRNVWVGGHDDTSINFHVGKRQADPLRILVRPPGTPNVLFSSTQFAIAHGSRASGPPNELETRFLQWLVKRMTATSLRRRAASR